MISKTILCTDLSLYNLQTKNKTSRSAVTEQSSQITDVLETHQEK